MKEFLREHLGENIGIGSGEIIDGNALPGEIRHQHDIIIYRKDYPKLHFAKGVDVFLAESVIATIEIKSTLDKSGLEQAIKAAYAVKQLKREYVVAFGSTLIPIRDYVFAYMGPEKMQTVSDWFGSIHKEMRIADPKMGGLSDQERLNVPSPTLDGVVILRKGILHMRNVELVPRGIPRVAAANASFFINDAELNNLLILFLLIIEAANKIAFSVWDYSAYLPKE